MSVPSQNGVPNFTELAAALAAIRPSQSEAQGLGKHVGTITVAAVIGMGVWITSTVSSLQSTLIGVSTTVQSINKVVDDVKLAQTGSLVVIGEIRTQNAGFAVRVATLEANVVRLNERVQAPEKRGPPPKSEGWVRNWEENSDEGWVKSGK